MTDIQGSATSGLQAVCSLASVHSSLNALAMVPEQDQRLYWHSFIPITMTPFVHITAIQKGDCRFYALPVTVRLVV